MLSDSQIQPLFRLLSLVGALILLSQALELLGLAASVPRGSGEELRLTMLGALAGRIPFLVLSDVVLYAGIIYQGSRVAFRLMGWVHLAITLMLGMMLLILARDFMVMRSFAPARVPVVIVFRAGLILSLTALLTLLTGWFTLRTSQKSKWLGRKRPKTPLLTDTERPASPLKR